MLLIRVTEFDLYGLSTTIALTRGCRREPKNEQIKTRALFECIALYVFQLQAPGAILHINQHILQ